MTMIPAVTARFAAAAARAPAMRLAAAWVATAARPAAVGAVRQSLAAARRFSTKLDDSHLAKQLKVELEYERSDEAAPIEDEDAEFMKTFLKKTQWEVSDVAGSKEVTLTRKFGSETVTVYFTTDALSDAEIPQEEGETETEEDVSIVTSIIVQKPNAESAIEITASIQDNTFYIENVSAYKPSSLAVDQSVTADWQRRTLYGGPNFDNLDEELQESFDNFLAMRGFDQDLSRFIYTYLEKKEQKEYVDWLGRVLKFVQ